MNKNVKIHDLIKDKSFLNWANQSNAKDVAKWNAWIDKNPEQRQLLEDAKIMVGGIPFKKTQVPDHQINKSWNTLAAKIQQPTKKEASIRTLNSRIFKIAAAILLLSFSILGIQKYWGQPSLIVVETDLQNTKSIELPDGSLLSLNTNSKISYADDWLNQDVRTIQLDGEAFFQVSKQEKGKIFQVQSNDLTVEVIGTAFNFNSKRANAIVSLVEGKVKLIKQGFGQKNLKAGETASFNSNSKEFDIQHGQTDYWGAWTMKKWSFGDGVPLTEILERIEETYGLEYEIESSKILQKRASGDVSLESRAVLLESLSLLLDLEMIVVDNKLKISNLKGE